MLRTVAWAPHDSNGSKRFTLLRETSISLFKGGKAGKLDHNLNWTYRISNLKMVIMYPFRGGVYVKRTKSTVEVAPQ